MKTALTGFRDQAENPEILVNGSGYDYLSGDRRAWTYEYPEPFFPNKGFSLPQSSPMSKRPLSVTAVGWLFVVAGVIGLVYHSSEFNLRAPFEGDHAWVLCVRILAIVGGIFLLRGANWARWLLIVWMAYHVALSTLHSASEVAIHSIILLLIAYLLFRPPSSRYFRRVGSPPQT